MALLNQIPNEPVKISIDFPTHAYFLSGIRDFTLNMVRNMTGFSEQWAFRFQSIVDELCNNAIEFGSAPGQLIRLTLISEKNKKIEIQVEDTGTGEQKMDSAAMRKIVDERRHWDQTKILGLRGRGLPQIVANWTDEIEFIDRAGGGLIVRAVKYLDKAQE